MEPTPHSRIEALSRTLALEQKMRRARDVSEFEFLAVNETHSLIPYRQAVLWRQSTPSSGRIQAVSGLGSVDRKSPFAFWLGRVLKGQSPKRIRPVTAESLPPELAREWGEWLPAHGLWVPLKAPDGTCPGGLFIVREEAWQDEDKALMEALAEIYGYFWSVLLGKKWWTIKGPRLSKIMLWAVLLLCLATPFIPARLSVLAPAEVIPLEPTVVRAPLDGVVSEFHVSPNDPVAKGDLLFSLDDTTLRNRLLAARKALAVARAEYGKVSRKALSATKDKADLKILEKHVEEKAAAVSYVQELLDKTLVKADQEGIAVFSDVFDWLGRPVVTGEKILTLARPGRAELEIRLPVGDAINLNKGAEVLLFLNVDPDAPIGASLSFASYRPEMSPDGLLAYRLKARFPEGALPPRIGLKGTAKIYGDESSLFYLVMRRPLAAVRQRLGL